MIDQFHWNSYCSLPPHIHHHRVSQIDYSKKIVLKEHNIYLRYKLGVEIIVTSILIINLPLEKTSTASIFNLSL